MKTTLHSLEDLKQVLELVYNPKKEEVKLPKLVRHYVEPEPEEEPTTEKILPYIPFVCTHCGKPTEKVTTSYKRGGMQLIPEGHAYCSGCFTHSKMISLQKIAEKRFKVEPANIHPTNDERRLILLTSIAKDVR